MESVADRPLFYVCLEQFEILGIYIIFWIQSLDCVVIELHKVAGAEVYDTCPCLAGSKVGRGHIYLWMQGEFANIFSLIIVSDVPCFLFFVKLSMC
jgi:hypothetical protein